jgi:hypothetical protein
MVFQRPHVEAPTCLRRLGAADRSSERIEDFVASSRTIGDLTLFPSRISKLALILNNVIQREKVLGKPRPDTLTGSGRRACDLDESRFVYLCSKHRRLHAFVISREFE